MRMQSATGGYLRKWFNDLTEIIFEGRTFPIPKDYDNWLTFRYGDYMTLPAEKDRKPHPVSALKLL
jgi:lipopolysaccharide cholinephosphotransferase